MRIIQLDETQTDISTRAHFHPLAIRLYGQHGINAAGPTGSEVRQASPPPPKPLLSPFIPSSPSTALHSYPSHTHTQSHTHFFKPPALVNNKLSGHKYQVLARAKLSWKDEKKYKINFATCHPLRKPHFLLVHRQIKNLQKSILLHLSSISSLSLPTVQLCRAQRRF